MTAYSPQDLATKIGSGLLSFPVTAFAEDLSLRRDSLPRARRVDEQPRRRRSLRRRRHRRVLLADQRRDLVASSPRPSQEVRTAFPVLAPAGGSVVDAIEQARIAEASRRRRHPAVPALPHRGLAGWPRRLHRGGLPSTPLGVVVYSRANMSLDADTVARVAERNANLIGFKDGVGSLDQMTKIYTAARRPPDLHRRPADRRDVRAAVPRARCHHLLVGHVQLRARIRTALLRRRSRQGPRLRLHQPARLRAAVPRDPRPQARLRGVDRQGRPERDRPSDRRRASAAHRPHRRRERVSRASSMQKVAPVQV